MRTLSGFADVVLNIEEVQVRYSGLRVSKACSGRTVQALQLRVGLALRVYRAQGLGSLAVASRTHGVALRTLYRD